MDEKKEPSCQKLLFSATLTRDPAKIAALGLRAPKYIVVQSTKTAGSKEEGVLDFVMEKFTMPATLTVRLLLHIHPFALALALQPLPFRPLAIPSRRVLTTTTTTCWACRNT